MRYNTSIQGSTAGKVLCRETVSDCVMDMAISEGLGSLKGLSLPADIARQEQDLKKAAEGRKIDTSFVCLERDQVRWVETNIHELLPGSTYLWTTFEKHIQDTKDRYDWFWHDAQHNALNRGVFEGSGLHTFCKAVNTVLKDIGVCFTTCSVLPWRSITSEKQYSMLTGVEGVRPSNEDMLKEYVRLINDNTADDCSVFCTVQYRTLAGPRFCLIGVSKGWHPPEINEVCTEV
jgi:hypothetical protein